ncbi:MAG: putative MFS-type transporter [Burkholderiaceae bacterium]|nr:MAG: putative MFS-type transporter [Burkholderiaceae bacterium]
MERSPLPSPGWWLATVVLVTLNLRPFLTAIGPLAPAIEAHTGMSLQALAWLTMLPMALMGAGTWLAPAVLRRLGERPAMTLALALIALGCALRLVALLPALLIGTAALCGAGVALVQGMLPGLIKLHTPRRVAPMMGLYSASLMVGGAFGAQLSPLAMRWGLGWQAALALWAAPALLALGLAWHTLGAMARHAAPGSASGADTGWLLRRGRSWLLVVTFGLMNGGYAIVVAWLAPHYQELGWSAPSSGLLVAVLSLAQAAAALTLPALAARRLDRRPWMWFALGCQALGFAMLAWRPLAAPMATAIVLGIGLGGCFALIMVVALDHLHQPQQAGALNALMQGGGFIIAALAPWVMAGLHQITGGFNAGWLTQFGAVLVVAALVTRLAPAHYDRVMRAPAAPHADQRAAEPTP